jgi:hypothetical protein
MSRVRLEALPVNDLLLCVDSDNDYLLQNAIEISQRMNDPLYISNLYLLH